MNASPVRGRRSRGRQGGRVTGPDERISELERENRILKKKLERSEINRELLQEALASHIRALKVSNAELNTSRELIRQSEARYRTLALYDILTGLPGRALFQERVGQALEQAAAAGGSCAVLFIDLDRFKDVNDSGGHEAGDAVLRETAIRLLSCIREGDTAARLGGDEFAVVLQCPMERTQAEIVARRIKRLAAEPVTSSGCDYCVGASIGIGLYPQHGADTRTLLRHADDAMYSVKRNGRNGWTFFGDSE